MSLLLRALVRTADSTVIAALGLAIGVEPSPAWPSPPANTTISSGAAGSDSATDAFERSLIEAQPVCIASTVWSAGELGAVLAYHYRRHDDRLDVGYFAFWSTERPWGQNTLTLTLLPATAIDAVYSHFLFVLPGLRDALYGPGDVEGATVSYRVNPDGTLAVLHGVAQNGVHEEVELSALDLLDHAGRVILMSDVWSHQLGAKGAARSVDEAQVTPQCFRRGSLSALKPPVISQFRLGSPESPRRARAAWRPFRDSSH